MKIYPSEAPEDCGIIPLLSGQPLIACDHCGIVAVDTPRFGWQRWTDHAGTVRHHCPAAAEYNEWVRNSLVHNVAPESGIEYEQWDDHADEQPELTLPQEPEAVTVARGAEDVISKAALDVSEAQFLGYADPPTEMPTAATDASFQKPSTEAQFRGSSNEFRTPSTIVKPIELPSAPTDLGDDPDGDASVDPRDT
jgi:hypothetical protein